MIVNFKGKDVYLDSERQRKLAKSHKHPPELLLQLYKQCTDTWVLYWLALNNITPMPVRFHIYLTIRNNFIPGEKKLIFKFQSHNRVFL